ncbi:hypothetical protein GF420_03915 [candidate division GN15 bacterium]|nr:hypothetical protein [candidate division GN15 bacterium]
MTPRFMIAMVLLTLALVPSVSAKKLNDHWSLTLTERFRLVTWDNAITLDQSAGASRAFTRHRTQLGAEYSPSSVTTFRLRFANEFRYYTQPAGVDFHFDEIFVDQLFVRFAKPWDWPVTLTLGRQNIMLGEGFVVMDGHPLDGSRSIYFNAIRFDWHIRQHHTLTTFASYKDETDTWLPIIHKQDQPLVEQPETGLGAYYVGRWRDRDVHGYVVHKRREASDAFPFESTVTTLGGRLKTPLSSQKNLTAVIEAAYQLGSFGDADRGGYGGYAYLDYRPRWSSAQWFLPSSLTVGLIYLSGDDPDTDDWEDWDPMFARWPKWSESYIYTQIREDAVAWWTNLLSLYATVRFTLSPEVDLRGDYHRLAAPHAATAQDFPGGTGTGRGDLFIGRLSYRFGERWSGHLLWEGFMPGDYYSTTADSYAWIRAELLFRY